MFWLREPRAGAQVASELLPEARQGCLERGAPKVSPGLQTGVEDEQLALSLLGPAPSTVSWGDGTPFLLLERLQHRSWVGQGFTGTDPAFPLTFKVRFGREIGQSLALLSELPPRVPAYILVRPNAELPAPDRSWLTSVWGRSAARLLGIPTLPSGTHRLCAREGFVSHFAGDPAGSRVTPWRQAPAGRD